MKVRATQLGYYNHKRRKTGEVFDIMDEKAFSEKWMEKVGAAKPKPTPAREETVAEAPAQSPSQEVI